MDWIAGALELVGNWLIGNKSRVGFLINLLGCLVWIAAALHLKVYGLLLVVVPALFINIRNWMKWRKPVGMAKTD